MLNSLLVFYYSGALVYLIVLLFLGERRIVLHAMILIACPFFSIFILRGVHRSVKMQGQLPEWLLRSEHFEDTSLQVPNIEKEINIIPFQDALLLNDTKVKRKLLLDLLKVQGMENAASLEQALIDKDPETSHYAAAAVQQAKDEIMNQIRDLETMLEEEHVDTDTLESYIDVLKHYFEIEFVDPAAQEKYKYKYFDALKQFIGQSDTPGTQFYIEAIDTAIQLNMHEEAGILSKQFISQYPEEEDAYFSSLAIYYETNDLKGFDEMIRLLRSSNTRLSPKRLNQLRFWLQGGKNGQEI